MHRLYYGYSKSTPAKGFILALKCDNSFFVVPKKTYEKIQHILRITRPVFFTDMPVYIDGVNI